MKKIVVDSGCDISKETVARKNLNVEVIPLNLQIGDETFVDDETLDRDDYLNKMTASGKPPKTSAPSPELFAKSFEEADTTFVVTMASSISGSYNSANLGKQMALEKDSSKFIHVVDSKTAVSGETTIALKLGELIAENLPNTEIVEKITDFVENMRTYIVLEKYDNLAKTGRLNPSIAKIASVMGLKAICEARDNEIKLIAKARGYGKALKKVVDMIIKDNMDFENRILSISHVKCYEKAIEAKNMILEKVQFAEVIITDTTGLCATYADIDGIVISF